VEIRMPRYHFGYGSNMDEKQMARRCPSSTPIGTASMPGYSFLINDRGFASITMAAGRVVHGLLWDLDETDEKRLDRYEGVAEGLYRKVALPARLADGSSVDALVYIACSNQPGTPRRGYLENILQAASEHGFPAGYLEELKSWLASRKKQ
jgi:cation transport regulator ChaC